MPFWRKDKNGGNGHGTNGHGSDNNGEKVNYKARLEHKQYLAQESPEPVYDVSDCGLKNVPSGVYSKCKVLRKEALLLQNNDLTSLSGGGTLSDLSSVLQVLDLRSNQLDKLPEEIGTLKELKVLYVQHNKLKRLPDTLGELRRLQSLDVSHNLLKELPSSLAKLTRLRCLDLSHNPKLTRLNKALARARALDKLLIEPADNFTYPEAKVCRQGTEAVMRFLCKECDIEYVSPSDYLASPDHEEDEKSLSENGQKSKNGFEDDPYEKIVRGNLNLIDKQKEEKLKEMRLLERERAESQAKEALLAASMQDSKKKLLTDLAAEEAKRDEAVKRLQSLKDREKDTLVKSLSSAESSTDALIQELMSSHAKNCDPQRVLEEMQNERKEMEEQFTIKAGEAEKLREQEVLKEMQRMMEEELKREQVRRSYEEEKIDIVKGALSDELANDHAVTAVLQSKGQQQQELISDLLADEKYQREAFSALFLQQDSRHKEISQQVEQIQNELANLTMVEMTKKDLKMEFERDVMAEKRETLTKLLVQLMDQKDQRAQELQTRLVEMDEHRTEETEHYWLIQYQKLLDAKPKSLASAEDKVDPVLRDTLVKAGADEYIPVFALKGIAFKQLTYMKDNDLFELGLHNTYLRQKILKCVEEFSEMEADLAKKYAGGGGSDGGSGDNSHGPTAPALADEPSAPPALSVPSAPAASESISAGVAAACQMEKDLMLNMPGAAAGASDAKPSAPPTVETFQSNECVVCLENKCNIIFLPCGHVCCCLKCEKSVTACPLCRAQITQKVKLNL